MDTENDDRLTAKDAAAILVVAGVTTVACIAAGKLAVVATDKAVDALINTMTLAKKRKQKVYKITTL